MALTIAQVFREHRRFTGDGLPGEPAAAPLPIGDPQSGGHSPTKREIREALGPLETAVDEVQELVGQAEAIRDVVAGYASDAVSQGNVPIYSTGAAVAALDVDNSITALRTNGRTTTGDGGGAFYVRDTVASPGSIIDLSGDHWRLASWPLNVRMFGAKGDGVTDDSNALQTAFTAAAGQHLNIPPGTYKCVADEQIVFASGVICSGYGATLDFSAAAEGSHVRVTGSVGANITLTGNANAGAAVIALSSTAGLAPGDVIHISSDQLVRLDAIGGSTTQTIGEFAVVRSITGLNVTIDGILSDTYTTAANAVVCKLLASRNNVIAGLTIIGRGAGGTSSDRGIDILYAENAVVRDCHIIDCERNGIKVEQTYKFLIDNNDIRCAFNPADTVPSSLIRYGICPTGCAQRGTISNNHITGGKHGIVWSENSRPGLSRDVLVTGNTIVGTGHCGIATHETNGNFQILANTLIGCAGGIDIRVRNGIVAHNEIRDIPASSSIGACVLLRENAGDLLIADNRFVGARYGVRTTGLPSLARPIDIKILNNHFEDINQHAIELEQLLNALGMTGLVIEGNSIRNVGGDGIKVSGEFIRPRIGNNYVLCDTPPTGYGVRLCGTLKAFVVGNTFIGMVPARCQPDGQGVPAVTRNPLFAGNVWDHSTAFLSNDSGTQIQRRDNTQIGDVDLVIASGVIAIPTGARFITVDTQSSASTDDLDTINGGDRGDQVTFYAASAARDVVFKDGTGNLRLAGDFTLSHTDDTITLRNNGANVWIEVARSDNAA